MTLIERIADLATAVGHQIRDAVLPRLLPAGGTTGQVLAKTGAADYAAGWSSAGGGSGTPRVFVQETRPVEPGPWVWWQTEDGPIIDCIVNDGA